MGVISGLVEGVDIIRFVELLPQIPPCTMIQHLFSTFSVVNFWRDLHHSSIYQHTKTRLLSLNSFSFPTFCVSYLSLPCTTGSALALDLTSHDHSELVHEEVGIYNDGRIVLVLDG